MSHNWGTLGSKTPSLFVDGLGRLTGAVANNTVVDVENFEVKMVKTFKGEMLTVEHIENLDLSKNWSMDPDEIKKMLCTKLVEELFNSDKILFTSQVNPLTDKKHYRARIYVTPNNETQFILQSLKNNKSIDNTV